jgi:glycine betaine/choline ABC-type transport system substrate-binding protein
MRPRTLLLALCLLGACSGSPAGQRPDDDAVVIAVFDFPESVLLTEIYAQSLEAVDIPVRREFDLGTRSSCNLPCSRAWWTWSPSTAAAR